MVLLIDNYDSFTYNLYDYILQLGEECKVIRNDEYTLEEIEELIFSSIVLSPGPGKPENSGICLEIIEKFYQTKPILGICLGHQALGQFFGAELVKAAKPMHGKTSRIKLENDSLLFNNLPSNLEVMRYHSLILKEVSIPLRVIARALDGEIMAIQHDKLPLTGVQFHPESILTKSGLKMLKSWFTGVSKM